MRVDVFTSKDRAREAYSQYRSQEAGKYQFWSNAGAFVSSFLIVYLICNFFTSYFFPTYTPDKLATIRNNPTILGSGIFVHGRSLILLAVIFLIFWLLTRFASARIAFRLISFYQGTFFGILTGAVVYLISWYALKTFGIVEGGILPWIIGSIGFLVVFWIGLKGQFLPGKGL